MKNRKRGKPVAHKPVICKETGKRFITYKEAGESVGGGRDGVRRCCEGTQRHHKGFHFTWDES